MQVADVTAFNKIVETIENKSGYVKPQAFGLGIATIDPHGRILSVHFPAPNFQANFGSAAIIADVVGYTNGTHTFTVSAKQLGEMLSYFTPFENDGKQHPNIIVPLPSSRDLFAGPSQGNLWNYLRTKHINVSKCLV